MEHNFRQLAQRHMWLSWLWGMYAVWTMGLLAIAGVAISSALYNRPIHNLTVSTIAYGLLIGFVGTMVCLGLPALLGVLVRRPIMQRIFTATTSRSGLILRTAAVFEASIDVFILLYLLLLFVIGSKVDSEMTTAQLVAFTAALFIGLSLPWLISSVAAAWWLGRRLFPR